ncbi:MAG: cytochrome ubiquinol oxidase subunit I [Bacteroidetes bacterium]|nr:MAG: cytochrome ubiquinol oxidase subunit I [Bacteroidota bacterium]
MIQGVDMSLVDWSRAQFALTAIYHWLFVPLTLGITFIIAFMETIYVKTGDESWKVATKFWMRIFGVNFAIGVATGIILEFEFGTNWSNYSWFVGDIFGAPLAIEGIMAFFMESTFIAVMFFGWNKVSKRFHLLSSWLTAIGANLSALWILVANGWMQFPAGMHFNPDTARNEMVSFWEVLFSPVAINKFLHTTTSGYVLASIVVIGISAWFLLHKREQLLAKRSIIIAGVFGLISLLFTIFTGDGSAYEVAQKQPMKLAAMEGIYNGQKGQGLVAVAMLTPGKEPMDGKDPYVFNMEIPKLLSLLGYRDSEAFVPGINDIIKGGYTYVNEHGDSITEPSAEEKIATGRKAINALKMYTEAREAGDTVAMAEWRGELEANFKYFGYGYLNDPTSLVPNVPMTFYSFRIMVTLGGLFLLFFVVVLYLAMKNRLGQKWLLWASIAMVPLVYICSEAGWIVAEVGRQPWVIQDIMPTVAAVSRIDASAVQVTFGIFAVLFTTLLIAELSIMFKQIKMGPSHDND